MAELQTKDQVENCFERESDKEDLGPYPRLLAQLRLFRTEKFGSEAARSLGPGAWHRAQG